MSEPDNTTPWRLVATVAAGAIVLLLFVSRFIATDQVYLRGLHDSLNDQLSYISVARAYADTGRLASTAIYPSTLRQVTPKNYLYMPGQYMLLGWTFKGAGFSVLASFFPGLIAYVLSVCLAFLIGCRMYGRQAALIAALLVAVFPLNIVFAFSAMCEMTLMAAALGAFTIFVYLPERWRIWIGPLLLVIPLMIRETGVLIAAPMLFLIASSPTRPMRRRIVDGAIFTVVSVVVFALVMSTAGAGRPSLFLNNLVDRGFGAVYSDAFATAGMDRSPGAIAQLVFRKFVHNIEVLIAPAAGASIGEEIALWLILAAIPAGAFLLARHRDTFAAGVAAGTLALLVADLLVYTVWQYRGVRVLLVMQPLAAIIAGSFVLPERVPGRLRKWGPTVATAAVALFLLYSVLDLVATYAPQEALNNAGLVNLSFLEQIQHDDRTVLVAPYWLTPEYALKHYPVRVSVIPANLATLRLLEKRFPVGTIVYPLLPEAWRKAQGQLTAAELQQDGWMPRAAATGQGITFLVLRRSPSDARLSPTSHPAPADRSSQR